MIFVEALKWLLDYESWQGSSGLFVYSMQHLNLSIIAVAIAAVIAMPVGWLLGVTGKCKNLVVGFTGVIRAIPILGLITLAALLVGIGSSSPIIALVFLAIPSILAGAYSGIESLDEEIPDAAKAQGMTSMQVLFKVQIPLGFPTLVGGLRSAFLQVIATATLAAYVGGGGLGMPMFVGLKTQNYVMMLGSSLLVIGLAFVADMVLGFIQSRVTKMIWR